MSVLKKDGQVTYFLGADNYFSHPQTDRAGQRFALATLIANRHVQPSQVEHSSLGIAHRTLMRWLEQLEQNGPGCFYAPRPRRGAAVMTPDKAAQCQELLSSGQKIAQVARLTGVGESTLRKAVRGAKVPGWGAVLQPASRIAAKSTLRIWIGRGRCERRFIGFSIAATRLIARCMTRGQAQAEAPEW